MTPPRLTERLDMLFDADFRALMDQRRVRRQPTMSPTACFAICAALVNHADGDGRCWPSQARIASHASSSRRTAQLALAILEDEGVVQVERRHRASGVVKDDTANRYRLVWSRLAELRRVVRTGAKLAHDDEAPLIQNMRETRASSGARSAHEHARDLQRTGASPAHEHARDSRTEPPIEPPTEPPPSPRAGGGGENLSKQESLQPPLDELMVQSVLAAYPGPNGAASHPEAKYDTDAAAVRAAIEREAAAGGMQPPLTLDELLEATRAYRTSRPRGPVMPRVWFRDRGYYGFVVTTRMQARLAAAPRVQPSSVCEVTRRDADAYRRSIEVADAALAPLSIEQLEQLRARVVAEVPWCEHLRAVDPRTHVALRLQMHDLLTRVPIAAGDHRPARTAAAAAATR